MNKENIISSHPSFTLASDIANICAPLKALNIHYFGHAQISDKQQISTLGNSPDFTELYYQKEYYRFDLHMAPIQQKESYVIWDNIKRKKESECLFNDFMDFNLGHTFTICLKQNDHTDYFHFATKRGDDYMNQQYLLNLNRLYQFIYYFREKVNTQRELRRAYDIKMSIPLQNSGYFVSTPVNATPTDIFEDVTHKKRIYLDHKTYLTLKEYELLGYLAVGKKIHEVAHIMKMSERTAKAHVHNIKQKLNCQNQFQLGIKYSSIKI